MRTPATLAALALSIGFIEQPIGAQRQGVSTSAASRAADRLAIEVGLTIVTTVLGEPQGDFESIKQVTEATPDVVRFTYTGDRRSDAPNERLQLRRTQSRADLRHARAINTYYAKLQPETMVGATSFTAAADILRELKGSGVARVDHIVGERGKDVVYPIVLTRLEPGTVPYQTIVNGTARALPAIHARSAKGDVDQADFYLLDDAENPLVLSWEAVIRGGKPFGARVIKLEDADRSLSSRICEEARVDIYGLYFDFNRDDLRAESELVLHAIADALAARPSCRLGIEGHTDNVGGAAFNLDLSNRRAAAVKRALVDRYHVAPERLDTVGYGLSKPKGSNDTAQGRARNRRVELVRREPLRTGR